MEKCLRGTSDVLHIIPVLKKIYKDSQSVTPSRRGIAPQRRLLGGESAVEGDSISRWRATDSRWNRYVVSLVSSMTAQLLHQFHCLVL